LNFLRIPDFFFAGDKNKIICPEMGVLRYLVRSSVAPLPAPETDSRKNDLHIRILTGFLILFWEILMAETTSILWSLMAKRRGAFQPNFGKMSGNCGYSPREPKPGVLQGFLERIGIGKWESEPV
jgi:hypothetical protein